MQNKKIEKIKLNHNKKLIFIFFKTKSKSTFQVINLDKYKKN